MRKPVSLIRPGTALAAALSFTALALCLSSSPSSADVTGYEIEGYVLSPDEAGELRRAEGLLRTGLAEADNGDWIQAKHNCGAALEIFYNLRLPERGRIKQAYTVGRVCIADAEAVGGNWERACRTYSREGYQTSRLVRAREVCRQRVKDEDAQLSSHSSYAATFATFITHLSALNALPEGTAREQQAARIAEDCKVLTQFTASVPPAVGAVGYCNGIVQFEQGESDAACRTLWSSAKDLQGAMSRQMLDEQRTHGREMQARLETFRAICADMEATWPDW